MPSDTMDERMRGALEALARPREAFRSAVVATLDQLRAALAEREEANGRGTRAAIELGVFGADHIDPDRFAAVTGARTAMPKSETAPLERAVRTLETLFARGDELFCVRVEPGGDLRGSVERALGEAGRAFGAARAAEMALEDRYEPETHDSWLERFPPSAWSRRERRLAPPLVVGVTGADLKPAGLSEFLDGSQKIVLVVDGEAPPAALVRLITPGVGVIQVEDPAELAPIAEETGPAVAAVVSPGASLFRHLPGANGRGHLSVLRVPEEEPRRSLGGLSPFQQAEEVRQLLALSSAPVEVPEAAPEAPGPADVEAPTEAGGAAPADALAAWILKQADLSGLQ